ncbi:group II intron reverse transcriptase/maturase [Nonomuraea phyllanthi]|uniref:Group II intron reverse transcriptase/maturase n=1 Tax=Nonomuraea phyllanthi TaxID=2219224 RepID=A0A5C4WUI8_9ACTN|nr:group II intron reverse transcriptase/maturase [Nonomuraea phyllanthi]KAB8196351.1 group II intron reverse transcriptase/maturase [Nonomuraea phyllanthi]
MNIGDLEAALFRAERRVLEIQTKLHRWAAADGGRRFDDLFNLVCDPAFLLVGWDRVRGNKGARTAGIDGKTVISIQARIGVEEFLAGLRTSLKGGVFRPLPVRERMIPKPGTAKRRRLGIPTVADRVVQASLKLVLEPIFEADFQPCSYGFRPNRRAQDAVSEVQYLTSRSYEWVVEADIAACFDEISHPALMDRIRGRICDKRVLALIKAFLKAGILGEDQVRRNTHTGTPQGGILSPLLANVALSVLDEHFAAQVGDYFSRRRRRHRGLANYRLIRYADDFVVVVSGTRAHAEAVLQEVAGVLAPLGLRLAADKTRVVHITQGLDFLGWRIQRHRKRGTKDQHYVYTYPSKKALAAITAKVKAWCWQDVNMPFPVLARRLNQMLRGWTAYFRPGVSSATFGYLSHVLWRQVFGWLRRKHRRTTWRQLRRHYCRGGWWPTTSEATLFDPATVSTTRYRYRGGAIASPWPLTA